MLLLLEKDLAGSHLPQELEHLDSTSSNCSNELVDSIITTKKRTRDDTTAGTLFDSIIATGKQFKHNMTAESLSANSLEGKSTLSYTPARIYSQIMKGSATS
jgi:hypothetical protein